MDFHHIQVVQVELDSNLKEKCIIINIYAHADAVGRVVSDLGFGSGFMGSILNQLIFYEAILKTYKTQAADYVAEKITLC